jgi:hypothetical protein
LLFIVGSETKDHRNLERMRERVTEIRTEPPTSLSRTEATMAMVRELRQSEVEEGDAEKHGFIYRFHLPLIRESSN